MTGIRIPVSADFDGASAEQQIAKLNEQMNRLAQTVAGANRVQFNPVGAATLDDLKKIEAKFKELTRISGGLRERIKATGQAGSSFGGLDWNRLYEDPAVRARKMHQAYQHVTAGSRYSVNGPAVPPPGQPTPPPGAPPPPHGPTFGGALGGIAGAGLRGAGPVGGVIANAGAAGASGGLGAGMMGLLGGLAALAVGKGVAAVKNKVDAAGQEGIGYDTLKRTLGDVNVSFNLLRNTLRSASDNIDVTFEQSQKLGTDFAKLAGISKEQYKTLADEVSVGGGFGRSYGIDPEQSNQFFGQMRGLGVTQTTNDSRKLALMIGEAVAKSGTSARTDEVLHAIASFTATQARNGLAGANAVGYAGSLSGLLASKTPGLDPQGAAALLNRVNGAIAGGGGAGEAGQNYLFNVLGKKHGLDPVQAMMLQQQGAFGTGRMAFGKDSLFSKFSSRFGGGVGAGAAESDETNLAAILARAQKDYKGNPSLMLNATARLLGVNENQAMALHTINPNDLGGMTGRMGRLGLNMNSLSATGISALSNIESGDPATLKAQADALRKREKNKLSDVDMKRLQLVEDGGDQEKLKDILTELTYTREQEQTEGSKTRESIQGVEKRIQELATHLVGPMNTMRDSLILMAGGGKMGATGIAIGAAEADATEKKQNLKAQLDADKKEQHDLLEQNGVKEKQRIMAESRYKMRNSTSPSEIGAERKRLAEELNGMDARTKQAYQRLRELETQYGEETKKVDAERDSKIGGIRSANTPAFATKVGAGATPDLLAKLAAADKELGLTPGTSAAVFQTESRFNGNALSNKGARGYAQIMPATQSTLEKRYGRKFDPSNPDDSVFMYSALMKENMDRFGNQDDSLRAYNAGPYPSRWGNSETVGYVPKVNANRASFSDQASNTGMPMTAMPDGHDPRSNAKNGMQSVLFESNVNLYNQPSGARAADSVVVKKRVELPSDAWGAR